MNNMFFWIIVFGWVLPVGIRMYNRARIRRLRDLDRPGFGGPGYGGPGYGGPGYGGQGPGYRYPDYPGQQYPPPPPVIVPGPVPYPPQQPGPEPTVPTQPGPLPDAKSPTPEAAGPRGYRARKLAELDQQFTDGKISMEEYMKRRLEIMNG